MPNIRSNWIITLNRQSVGVPLICYFLSFSLRLLDLYLSDLFSWSFYSLCTSSAMLKMFGCDIFVSPLSRETFNRIMSSNAYVPQSGNTFRSGRKKHKHSCVLIVVYDSRTCIISGSFTSLHLFVFSFLLHVPLQKKINKSKNKNKKRWQF